MSLSLQVGEQEHPQLREIATSLASGGKPFLSNLRDNLILYMDQEICNYCGWIEGYHPVIPLGRGNCDTRTINLTIPCGQCYTVKYCSTFCMQLDWENHQIQCHCQQVLAVSSDPDNTSTTCCYLQGYEKGPMDTNMNLMMYSNNNEITFE